VNRRGASNVCKLCFKIESLVRVPQHSNTNTSCVRITVDSRWLLKRVVKAAFAYEYAAQGPLSFPNRTSERSGWFLDGWVQPQRSQKSQTQEPHENRQPAATRSPWSAPNPQALSALSSVPGGNQPPRTRCGGNELLVLITSSAQDPPAPARRRQAAGDGPPNPEGLGGAGEHQCLRPQLLGTQTHQESCPRPHGTAAAEPGFTRHQPPHCLGQNGQAWILKAGAQALYLGHRSVPVF